MAVEIHPFCGIRPKPELVERVAAPPYDVLTTEEARALAADNPLSFLHVTKPEIDLDPGTDPYSEEVYEKGRQNFERLLAQAFVSDPEPTLYVYQQRMGDHVQAGVVAGASVRDYEEGRIAKHELTREAKERDRVRHIEALRAHTGPVFLTYEPRSEIDELVDRVRASQPVYDFAADDGVRHTLWVVGDGDLVGRVVAAFAKVDRLYVADGHHRSAAAATVARRWRERHGEVPPDHEVNYFLSVIFPADQLRIMAYNRVVRDLNGLDPEAFLDRVRERFTVQPTELREPERPRTYCMYLEGAWYLLEPKPGTVDLDDPVASLDVAVLQDQLLGPILGIADPRRSERIDFVGGVRGADELERRCREDMRVAFSLYPTAIEQLIAVARAGRTMPPKSTWFEPKLRSGLLVHRF